jgi:hypothetical protein
VKVWNLSDPWPSGLLYPARTRLSDTRSYFALQMLAALVSGRANQHEVRGKCWFESFVPQRESRAVAERACL